MSRCLSSLICSLGLVALAAEPLWSQDAETVLAIQLELLASGSDYTYDPQAGGLVDLTSEAEIPLVWTTSDALDWLTNTTNANQVYVNEVYIDRFIDESGHAAGHTDWRLATKAELQDAAWRGIYAAQEVVHKHERGGGGPYRDGYLASDSPFKSKGIWWVWHVSLVTGEARTASATSGLRVILVRGGNPPAPTEPKPGPKPR